MGEGSKHELEAIVLGSLVGAIIESPHKALHMVILSNMSYKLYPELPKALD